LVSAAPGSAANRYLRLVISQSLGLTQTGLVLGIARALPTDPATFRGVAILFAVVASVAGLIPARVPPESTR
jgi:hypothetical protein